MKLDEVVDRFAKFIPSITPPLYRLSFKEKLKWTFIILVLYIFLSYVPVIGLTLTKEAERFMIIQHLLGARFGSLLTLGIAPIVTAGIILQLLVGSKIINLDTTLPEGRKKFQTWMKVLAIIFCVVESIAYVVIGPLSTTTFFLPFVIFQIALGGILVILMDDVINKWGLGSGISLFIVAGISSQIFIQIFSPFASACSIKNLSLCIPSIENQPVGHFWRMVINFYGNEVIEALVAFFHILSTALLLLLVVFIQGIKIDVPLAFSAFRGFGRSWSLKLLYTSNIPVIFAWAFLANLQMFSHIGLEKVDGNLCGPLGCFDPEGRPVSGFAYYVYPPAHIIDIMRGAVDIFAEIPKILIYSLLVISLATIFSVVWVETSGMNARSIAEQIEKIGMQIPGYRRDPRVIESVLNKYIPPLSVLGGIIVGFLAVLGDFLGVIGGGVGLLLSTMIIYNYYELIRNEDLEGMPEFVRKMLGG